MGPFEGVEELTLRNLSRPGQCHFMEKPGLGRPESVERSGRGLCGAGV